MTRMMYDGITPASLPSGGDLYAGYVDGNWPWAAKLTTFHGKPLVQMAFLDPEHGPIAYCVIDNPARAEIPRTTETLGDFTIVHWASGGQARLLIGRAPAERLQALAVEVPG